MLRSSNILFESGRLLNGEMLNELQEFSLRGIELKYYDFSTGIILGLDFENDEKCLYLAPGILKYEEEYFFLTSRIKVMDFSEKGGKKNIYLVLQEEKEEKNIRFKEWKVEVSEKKLLGEKVFYLGEFQHHTNEKVNTKYNSLEDMGVSGYYINTLERRYSGRRGATLSPEILYQFAKKNTNEKLETYLDNYILTQGLNKEIVEIDVLEKYLGAYKNFTELYERLLKKKFKKEEVKVQVKTSSKQDFTVE